MSKEKVVSAVRRARADFKRTPAGELSGLLALRSKWRRRLTIAQNKLDLANDAIVDFASRAIADDEVSR